MKKATWNIVAILGMWVSLVLVITFCAVIGIHHFLVSWQDERISQVYYYVNHDNALFLKDTLAVEMTRQAMKDDGYDIDKWKPNTSERTQAPDASIDKYLIRSNKNMGIVEYKLIDGTERRIVEITKTQDAVECRIVRPK